MSASTIPVDRELTAWIERKQRAYLRARGLMQTIGEFFDGVEFTPIPLLYMRLHAAIYRLTGQRAAADTIDAMLGHISIVRRMHPGSERPWLAAMEKGYGRPPTRHQRKADYYTLCVMRDAIATSLREAPNAETWNGFCASVDKVLWGTAPIGRCNAFIRPNCTRDKFAILVDDEILRVASQMSYLLTAFVRDEGGRMVVDRALVPERLDPAVRSGFLWMINAFVESGSTRLVAPVTPCGESEVRLQGALSEFGTAFCLSHELAHAHLGHTSFSSGGMEFLEMSEEEERDELAFLLEAECEADALAKEVVQNLCRLRGYDPALAGVGGAAILAVYASAYDAIASIVAEHATKEQRDEAIRVATGHPTPDERLARLLSSDNDIEAWATTVIARLRDEAINVPIRTIHPRWYKFIAALIDVLGRDGQLRGMRFPKNLVRRARARLRRKRQRS